MEPTTAEKISKLHWSTIAHASNIGFVQLTYFGSIFVLFLSALALDKTQIGFILSLIQFSDAIALFIAPTVARIGVKRIYVTFMAIRTTITLGLLAIPWVTSTFQGDATLIFITVVVALFAICRSFVMTAHFPWMQEYVPKSVQGKHAATNNIFMGLTGFVVVTIAGIVLGQTMGLTGYLILISAGILFGYVTAFATSRLPGGLPSKVKRTAVDSLREIREAARDRDFMRYLYGVGSVTLVIVSLTSFVPLFLQEQAGLSAGNVVLVQTSILLGGLLSTFLWGWAADRYGSLPVMLSGPLLRAILPVFWILMPRNDVSSLYIALIVALLQGVADMSWVIGSTRQLYVSIVPPEKKTAYMAFYTAWIGVVGGIGQLAGGQIVELSANVSGRFLIFVLDPYTGLFILGIILPLLGVYLLSQVRTDARMTVSEFAGMFVRGNPVMAITFLAGYRLFSRDEESMITMTERLGRTNSPLTIEELLEALADPRFNVRFEAIISIARTRQDPRLTEALIEILNGTELALSGVAAWALGRTGDLEARDALREALDSKYRSIQAYSIRALGTLDDQEMAPVLLERLERESTDKGLQMACASALGKMAYEPAAPAMLKLLNVMQNAGARRELGLSIARLIGSENHFVSLAREAQTDAATATAQAVTAFKKKLSKDEDQMNLQYLIDETADALARGNMAQGANRLVEFIEQLPQDKFSELCLTILQACSAGLRTSQADRPEYLLLTLHVIEVGWQE